jgi:hypothetical protein
VRLVVLILQVALLAACNTKHPTELESLEGAASAFRTIFDQSLAGTAPQAKVLSCEISGQEAMSLMMPLKARMDPLMQVERESYQKDPQAYAKAKNFAACEERCLCGLYARMLEDVNGGQADLAELNKKAEVETSEQRLTCAQAQKDLCGSQLLKDLRAEAAQNSSAQQ